MRASCLALALALGAATSALGASERKTVCTITVNSSDEKEAMRARLPKGEYDFVELVEKGRGDWLRSSCERKIQCDALVISGHFNAGEDFYSDKVESHDSLRMDELERASCSESCPGVFSRLKEVYLFGCESLNPDSSKYASAYGESGRDRMRRLFANVPTIYGFSGPAPVGATAAALLNRYFDTGAKGEIASGRPSSRLLSAFSRNSMVAIPGMREHDARMAYRRQVCQFYDERRGAAQKLGAIHAMMKRDMGEARAFFERIENLLASVPEEERRSNAFAHALAEISADDAARSRYLAIARAERAEMRARMVKVAATVGWLSPAQEQEEHVRLASDLIARDSVGYAEVNLICSLNREGVLDAAAAKSPLAGMSDQRVSHAAALACLGRPDAHARVVRALVSSDERDVRIAQAYLRNRPVSDTRELRAIAAGIPRSGSPAAQVRALETLARLNITDREIIDQLAQAFADSRSPAVQRAIAEVFIRSDAKALPKAQLAALVRRHRLKGDDLIDQLLLKLQS
ncbi:MAG TPA: hypothetical protein VM051_04450 [Usitatibacter sp.]|nr:hypothetical protein [Usitatibacter sp.]